VPIAANEARSVNGNSDVLTRIGVTSGRGLRKLPFKVARFTIIKMFLSIS